MSSHKSRALFLDRDGVINIDKSYVYKIEDFEFIDGVFEFLKEAERQNLLLIIVTNQSGIGRGYYTLKDFNTLTKYMLGEFQKRDIHISKVYYCPHSPEEGCRCRKPNNGMLLDAKDEFDIDLENSIMIGDKESDMKAAENAGIKERWLFQEKSFDKKWLGRLKQT